MEWEDQFEVVKFIRTYTTLPLISIPNEGIRTPKNGARLKAMGMLGGASDMFIARAVGIYHGLFVELKYGKNKLTPKQIEFQTNMTKEGYKCITAYGAAEAIDLILDFYDLRKGRFK